MTIENARFSDVVRKYLARAKQKQRYSYEIIAQKANLPKTTISNWANDIVQRPQEWEALARFAHAIELGSAEFSELLRVAGYPSVFELFELAKANHDEHKLTLLTPWTKQNENVRSMLLVTPTQVIFQAIPALSNLVGRTNEFQQLKNSLIVGGCICVLRGMSGVGKTVLAAQAANELRSSFPDGVLWAQLDKSNVDAILRSFAKAYGQDVSEYHDEGTLSANVRNIFANKRALIILDGAYSRESIAALLPPTTGGSAVIITTTSRKLLAVEAVAIDLLPFDKADSLAIFVATLGKARVAEAAAELEQIIDLVGGLPLALKIIASNLPAAMTVREYYELLRDEEIRRLHLYEGDEASQQTRLSFEVSYKLLSEPWKKLIGYLSLFKGADFSLAAIAAVANVSISHLPHLKMDLNHLLSISLIEASRVDEALLKPFGPLEPLPELVRYRQHALLAFFGAEKLAQDFAASIASAQQRAATYYVGFVQRYVGQYVLLELEWRNLFAALLWLLEDGKQSEFYHAVETLTTLQLGVAGFLDGQGHWREAIHLLEAVQNNRTTPDPLAQASVKTKLGLFHLRLAERELADHYLQQAQTTLATVPENAAAVTCQAYAYEAQAQLWLAQGLAEKASACVAQGIATLQHFQNKEPSLVAALLPVEGYLLVRHATIAARTGDLNKAQAEIKEALDKLPPEPTAARVSALLTLGNIYDLQGAAELAEKCFRDGVDAAKAIGDNRRLADLWRNLAIHAEEAGDFDKCADYNKQALDFYRRIGDVVGQGSVASNLSVNYLRQGKSEAALSYIQETRRIADVYHVPHLGIYANVNLAHYYFLRAEYTLASRLLTEAHGQSQQLGEFETLAEILRLQAQVAHQQGAYNQALELIETSIQTAGANEWEAKVSRQVQAQFLADKQAQHT